MSTALQQGGGADAPMPGPMGEGGAPSNGDRDSVDDVIERLLSVRGECLGTQQEESSVCSSSRFGVLVCARRSRVFFGKHAPGGAAQRRGVVIFVCLVFCLQFFVGYFFRFLF